MSSGHKLKDTNKQISHRNVILPLTMPTKLELCSQNRSTVVQVTPPTVSAANIASLCGPLVAQQICSNNFFVWP